jgi:hypothetical protein
MPVDHWILDTVYELSQGSSPDVRHHADIVHNQWRVTRSVDGVASLMLRVTRNLKRILAGQDMPDVDYSRSDTIVSKVVRLLNELQAYNVQRVRPLPWSLLGAAVIYCNMNDRAQLDHLLCLAGDVTPALSGRSMAAGNSEASCFRCNCSRGAADC